MRRDPGVGVGACNSNTSHSFIQTIFSRLRPYPASPSVSCDRNQLLHPSLAVETFVAIRKPIAKRAHLKSPTPSISRSSSLVAWKVGYQPLPLVVFALVFAAIAIHVPSNLNLQQL